VYRFGGEEFLMVLPNQTQLSARSITSRALSSVRELAIPHEGDPAGMLTLSAGISAFSSEHRVDAQQLLGEADSALYTAKAAGRNRVELAL
jgi:diguanylate cyclase (GGDEF)-like protein